MIELTLGQQRAIEESTQGWRMLIASVGGSLSDVPEDLRKKIDGLEADYKKAFGEFYTQAVEAQDDRDDDELADAFDEKWATDHPEFYDMRLLFADCGEDALKAADEVMKYREGLTE